MLSGLLYRIKIKRLVVVAILLFFIVDMYQRPLRDYGTANGETTGIALFAFLFCRNYFMKMFLLIVMFYFSDVPFLSREEQYYLVRMGREKICIRNIISMIINSIVLSTCFVVISIVDMGKCFRAKNKWSLLEKSLPITDICDRIGLQYGAPQGAIETFSPVSLAIREYFYLILAVLFVGMIMYALTLMLPRGIAMIASGIVIMLPDIMTRARMYPIYYSPMSWLGCDSWRYGAIISRPDGVYILAGFILLNIVLAIISVGKIKRIEYV